MDSVNILVIDRTPESSEQINSLLRNSGIPVHVLHVQSLVEAKRTLEDIPAILTLYCDPEPVEAGLEEISNLCSELSIPCAIYSDLDNTERLVELLKQASCIVIDAGNPDRLVSTVSALADTHATLRSSQNQKAQLDELEQRYDLLLESARDAIAYIHEGLHVYANSAYLASLRLSAVDDLAGISLLEVMKLPEGNFKSVLRDLSAGKFPGEDVEVEVNRPDGSTFNATLNFSSATFDGEECIQMMLQESDQASELAAELERMRVSDPLTQLANRNAFTAQVDRLLNNENINKHTAAVLYMEPDGLESAQAEIGLPVVDACVMELANVVREYLEEGDVAGRITDQGIAVLASRKNKEQVEAFAKAVMLAFKNVIVETQGKSFSTSCSVGVVTLGKLVNDAQTVISEARTALNEAAEKGDELNLYRPQLSAVALAEDEDLWLRRIRYALKNEDFHPVQQSIVDLDGEGEHLLENKVCLRAEEGDFGPEDYSGVAEKHDLAGTIDRNVIPAILRSISDSNEEQVINLSSSTVADAGFPAWLSDHLKMYAVDTQKLVIQIPADTAQANLKPTQRLMRELGPKGARLSISLFGPERRNHQLLDHLDAQYIKLQTSLTTELASDSNAQEAIRAIVEIANTKGASVIADEITDTSNLAVLWQCGVKLIAGTFLKETSQVVGQ